MDKTENTKDPLSIRTILYDTETGFIRPIATDEDREWIARHEESKE